MVPARDNCTGNKNSILNVGEAHKKGFSAQEQERIQALLREVAGLQQQLAAAQQRLAGQEALQALILIPKPYT